MRRKAYQERQELLLDRAQTGIQFCSFVYLFTEEI